MHADVTDSDPAPGSGAPATGVHRGRVLVVDDDASLAEMLTIVLRQEGFDPVVCATGDAALPAFREHRPDIVLLAVRRQLFSHTDDPPREEDSPDG